MPRFGAFRSAAIVTLTLLSMQQTLLHAQEKPAPKSTPAAAAATIQPEVATAQYIGSETCKTCHEDVYNGWEKSPHWQQTYKEGGIAKHGCEDCHGPGAPRGRRRGQNQDIHLSRRHSTKEIDDALPDLPRGRRAAHERDQFGAYARTT